MHQSIETPGLSEEFNIYQVLKNGLLPRPRGQEVF